MNIYLLVILIAVISNIIGLAMKALEKRSFEIKLSVWTIVLCLVILVGGGFLTKNTLEYISVAGSITGAFILAITLFFQIRSSRRQQVESKFFELVKYYRDNITEMHFKNPFYYKDGEREFEEEYVHGRRVIKTIFEQYKVARKICHEVIRKQVICYYDMGKIDTIKIKYIENGYDCIKGKKDKLLEFNEDLWKQKYVLNEIAYQIVFWGIPLDVEDELDAHVKKLYDESCCISDKDEYGCDKKYKLKEIIKRMVAVWEYKGKAKEYSVALKMKEVENISFLIKKSGYKGKVKFFGGHQYHLGHYFRHLYQAVKYIDSQKSWLFSQEEKEGYIKTLRAQMSNYEQALLFINSLTRMGRDWEYDSKDRKLISEYNLIKNLPQNFIPYMKPQYFYPCVDYEWHEDKVEC